MFTFTKQVIVLLGLMGAVFFLGVYEWLKDRFKRKSWGKF